MLVLKLLPSLLLVTSVLQATVEAQPAKCEKKEFAETQAKYQQCAAAKIASISKALEEGAGLETLCSAVRELIHSCGDELGWCFTEDQVEETKTKQRVGLESVLSQHLAAPSLESCLADNTPSSSSSSIREETSVKELPTTTLATVSDDRLPSPTQPSSELPPPPLSSPTRVPRLLPVPKSSSSSSSSHLVSPSTLLPLLIVVLLLQT